MFRCRVYIGPSFQLGELFSGSVHGSRVLTRPLFIRYRAPVVRNISIPVWLRSSTLRDIKHGSHGRCKDEGFEGGIVPGGLEDGERSCDGDQGFGESKTRRRFVR